MKDLPREMAKMNVVNGEGSQHLCDSSRPSYSPNLTIQSHGQGPVNSSFIVNASLYKIQCIKECRWPGGQ